MFIYLYFNANAGVTLNSLFVLAVFVLTIYVLVSGMSEITELRG